MTSRRDDSQLLATLSTVLSASTFPSPTLPAQTRSSSASSIPPSTRTTSWSHRASTHSAPRFQPYRFRKLRFVRIDGAVRQGSDAQQCLRTARLGVCRAHPSRAKCELVLHCNRCCISQEFAEGTLR